MKTCKFLSAVLTLIMVFTLASCGEEKSSDPNMVEIDNFKALCTGSKIVKDSEDKDAIAIDFEFTNNGDEAESFSWAFYYDITQGGEELEYAVVFVSEDSYDTLDDTMDVEVAPGETKEVTMTYELKDSTTPVEIDFSSFSTDDTDTLTIDMSTVKK